jgi:IPT/TIG domain
MYSKIFRFNLAKRLGLGLVLTLLFLFAGCGGGGGGGGSGPSISSFAPNSASIGGSVTVNGSNFGTSVADNTVKVNGIQAIVSSASSAQLVFVVPVGASTGKISVATSNGTATSATDLLVVQSGAAPTITSFNPAAAAVGAAVTIVGTNFDPTAANNAVKINGTTAAVTSSSATQIIITVPVGANSGKITVQNGGGTASSSTDISISNLGSSASASGSTGLFTQDGATFALTPAAGGSGVKLVSFPNTGSAVGVVTVSAVTARTIVTTLGTVDGVSVDPSSDLGVAFSFHDGKISVIKLSTATEIGTYDTSTTNSMGFSGANSVKISGMVMDTSTKRLVIATADGFEIVDYSDPLSLTKVREISSVFADPVNGVGIAENFAYDPNVNIGGTSRALILSGEYDAAAKFFEVVDVNSGKIYKPDSATDALFGSPTVDAIAVDTNYHVAVLADESSGTYFVNLAQVVLNDGAGTFSVPGTAFAKISTYSKFDNLGIDNVSHLLMMGKGYGGNPVVVAKLKDPNIGLGFEKEVQLPMPTAVDDLGANVTWRGGLDPHTAGAFRTDANHPTLPNTALGFWVSRDRDHVAFISLQKVLDGKLANPTYDPSISTPKDIAYFAIP